MQDIFIEYLVKQAKTPKTAILKFLIFVGAFFLAIVFFIVSASDLLGMLSFFGLFLSVGVIFGAYYLITSMNIEFEYSITNGEMDVDKIIAQRKRRRLISVKWRDVEAFGNYKPAEHVGKNYANSIFACDHPQSDNLWYCVTRVPQKGQVFLVFNASEKMLEAIKKYLPKQILFTAFRRG